ncbi:MAG: hypothetical protein ACYSR9_03980 [Planctomycetota bacterium]
MTRITYLMAVVSVLLLAQTLLAQEKIIDVRQEMADNLTEVKEAAARDDWAGAQNSFNKAKQTWQNEVKPLLVEDQAGKKRFSEYFGRMDEVEAGLNDLTQLLQTKKQPEIESKVNAIIWSISHHPRGFDVPEPRYSTWDWVFGLGIGLGFCLFAVVFGLYLRRSYYRRYARQQI